MELPVFRHHSESSSAITSLSPFDLLNCHYGYHCRVSRKHLALQKEREKSLAEQAQIDKEVVRMAICVPCLL